MKSMKINPEMYFDKDADLKCIISKHIGIIGYGNQGKAQALNLRDSGLSVSIGLRNQSESIKEVINDNFVYDTIENTVKRSDIICILIPDQIMPEVYKKYIEPYLSKNNTLLFSHGYTVQYKQIIIPSFIDVIMAAPSGPGKIVRQLFVEGRGVPNILAIYQDISGLAKNTLLAYSKAIGGTRVGSIMSSFKEETETDLFGEQAVLCGGIPKLIEAAFNILVENGYQPIVAWYVCFYEVKLIVDLFHEKGFSYMFDAISDTAEFGAFKIGEKIINKDTQKSIKQGLQSIKSGQFQKEWNDEANNNFFQLKKFRKKQKQSLFQKTTDKILALH